MENGCRNPFFYRAGFIGFMKEEEKKLIEELSRRNPFFYRAGFIMYWLKKLESAMHIVVSQSLFL